MREERERRRKRYGSSGKQERITPGPKPEIRTRTRGRTPTQIERGCMDKVRLETETRQASWLKGGGLRGEAKEKRRSKRGERGEGVCQVKGEWRW